MVPVAKGYIIAVHRVRRKIGPIITIMIFIPPSLTDILFLPDEKLIINKSRPNASDINFLGIFFVLFLETKGKTLEDTS